MILDFFKRFPNVETGAVLLDVVEQLAKVFEEEYLKDGNAKDAMIDSVCEYLQSLKGKK